MKDEWEIVLPEQYCLQSNRKVVLPVAWVQHLLTWGFDRVDSHLPQQIPAYGNCQQELAVSFCLSLHLQL